MVETPNAPTPPTHNNDGMVIKEESRAFVYAAKCFGRVIRDVFVLRSRYARARLMPDRPDVLNVPLRAAIFVLPLSFVAVTLMALSMGATPDGKAHSMIQMSVNLACAALLLVLLGRVWGGKGSYRQSGALALALMTTHSVLGIPPVLALSMISQPASMGSDAAKPLDGAEMRDLVDANMLENNRGPRTSRFVLNGLRSTMMMPACQHHWDSVPEDASMGDVTVTVARKKYKQCARDEVQRCAEETGNSEDECRRTLDPEGTKRLAMHQQQYVRYVWGAALFSAITMGVLAFFWFISVRCLADLHGFSRWRARVVLACTGLLTMITWIFVSPLISRAMRPLTDILEHFL